jgi:hypothetical protein
MKHSAINIRKNNILTKYVPFSKSVIENYEKTVTLPDWDGNGDDGGGGDGANEWKSPLVEILPGNIQFFAFLYNSI